MDLIIIGLLGGLITGISPCILPVLPVIFLTGGAQSARYEADGASRTVPARRSRPYLVIAGLMPCAGPVLAAIIVAGATGRIGLDTVLLTASFAVGVAVPLLAFALAGRGVVERIRAFRTRERGLRIAAGVAMLALAVGLVFNAPQQLQRLVPDYTAALHRDLTDNDQAAQALGLGGLVTDENRDLDNGTNGADELQSCGTAPAIRGISSWLNTPDGAGIDLAQLRGKVVLIDFWAYSCINCQRSIPHVVAWDKAYRDAGLQVIGIHSPEYAFEKDASNVAAGARDFGIDYPVALDNDLSTWTAYRNRYWPAHYLIDASGTVRHISFGEGNDAATEKMIRELLEDADPGVALPAPTEVADDTPDAGSTTRETFLGSSKDVNFAGPDPYRAGPAPSPNPRIRPPTRSRWTARGPSRPSSRPRRGLNPRASASTITRPRCAWCSPGRGACACAPPTAPRRPST